jgi:hypothetical protein
VPRLKLYYDYELPLKVIYDWWTDLSGTGYVGVRLKSVRPIGKEGEKILVQTKWKMMGMNMTLVEKLSLISQDHWIWEPHVMGIDIVDDFRLRDAEGGEVRLTIESTMNPAGMKGKAMQLVMGRMLDKIMINEWDSADRVFREEVKSKGR